MAKNYSKLDCLNQYEISSISRLENKKQKKKKKKKKHLCLFRRWNRWLLCLSNDRIVPGLSQNHIPQNTVTRVVLGGGEGLKAGFTGSFSSVADFST